MQEKNPVFQPSMLSFISQFVGVAAILLIFAVLILLMFPLAALVILPLIVLLGIFSYLDVKNTYIELLENGVQVRRGVIAKKQMMFLYSQIQDVTESQGLIFMGLGLKTISIKTMTIGSAFGGVVNGLRIDDADYIRKYVLTKIGEVPSRPSASDYKTSAPQRTGQQAEPQESLAESPYKPHFIKAYVFSGLLVAPMVIIIAFFLILIGDYGFLLTLAFYAFMMLVIGLISVVVLSLSFRYSLGKTRLEIVQGIFSFHRNNIPFSKTQDILLFRPIMHRFAGLCDVTIETGEINIYPEATTGGKTHFFGNVIPALNLNDAIKLRNDIFRYLGVSLDQLSPELSREFPLENKKIIKRTFAGAIALWITVILLAIFFAAYLFASFLPQMPDPVLIVTGVAVLLVVIFIAKLVHEYLYLKTYFYNVTPDAVIIRKGVFNVKEIVIPYRKVENIFVDQDILDKLLGIYDLHLSTVTIHSAYFSHIDGLSRENAEKLKKVISSLVSESLKGR